MKQKVLSYIKKQHMIENGDRVLAALSGGTDSVALLYFLKEIQREYRLTILAVHVNHGIREEAGEDEAFCERLCKELDIPFRCCRIEPGELEKERGMGLEEAARAARYALLEQCRREEGCDKIAVAHHANDNAETMLFQLFRGSGLKGLSGIPAVRDRIIRPFLCVTREEIGQYLRDNALPHVEDGTNQDVRYSRNRIRAEIIPAAEKVNAGAVENMGRCARQLRDIQEYLEAEAEAFLGRNAVFTSDGVSLPLTALRQLPAALQREVLMESVSRVGGSRKDLTFAHIEAIRELFDKNGQKECILPCGLTARKTYETMRIFREKCAVEARDLFFVPINGEIVLPEGGKLVFRTFPAACPGEKINNIPQNDCTKWFDCDKIRNNLVIRHRKQGDYLTVTADGGTKSLQDYLVNARVAREERDGLWLLADGPHILWIVGRRISMAYKVTKMTQNILEVHLEEKADGRESGSTDSGGGSEQEDS